jgi:hypothetical protein
VDRQTRRRRRHFQKINSAHRRITSWSPCAVKPARDSAAFDQALRAAQLKVQRSGRGQGVLVGVERQMIGRPSVFVGEVADAEIEGFEFVFDRSIDQMLQQDVTDAVAAVCDVIGRAV